MRVFPFRYKLTLLIAAIVVPLLGVVFFVVQAYIEDEFRDVVSGHLEQTERYVAETLRERQDALFGVALALADEKLVLDVLSDETLNRWTRDDIIATEAVPERAADHAVVVLDAEGAVVADNVEPQEWVDRTLAILGEKRWFQQLAEAEDTAGYVFVGDSYWQVAGVPVFIAEEMIGAVLLSRELAVEDLAAIKESSLADIAVIRGKGVLHSTLEDDPQAPESLSDAFSEWLAASVPPRDSHVRAREVSLRGERFLVRVTRGPDGLFPPYAVVQSLDERLAFLRDLELTTIGIGATGIGIGVALGFVLALAVSRPIGVLRVAAREVGRENLEHRVDIRTHDEFSELGDAFNRMTAGLAEKQKIRSALDKSVSREVAEHMLRSGAQLGGERLRATVLFSDIRDFSTLAEEMDPSRLIDLLNGYFTRVNRCIDAHRGVTDKFIGDAVMALFGAPVEEATHGADAVLAARDMLAIVESFNREVAVTFGCEFRIGVGINTGDVVAGLVGSEERLSYTVVGDDVNLASRLEGLTKVYAASLIVSEATWLEVAATKPELHEELSVRELDRVQVKGRSQPVRIYEVLLRNVSARELAPQLEIFADARATLARGDFVRAAAQLEVLLRVAPDDEGARSLYERCLAYAKAPDLHTRDYDAEGVRVLTAK